VSDYGLFIGFGWPVRGREQKATQVFGEAAELWTKLQQEGEIESFEAVFLEPHGGDLSGFFLVRGNCDNIARIRVSDEVLQLSLRAGHIVQGFGAVSVELGDRIPSSMQDWLSHAQELA
jgi:hypothetical protein